MTELPVSLAAGNVQQTASAGILVDLATAEDTRANQDKLDARQREMKDRQAVGLGGSGALGRTIGLVGDFAQDRVKVLFDPNAGATGIFGVSRYTEYAESQRPLTQTLKDALIEKYGQPTRSAGNPGNLISYTWMQPGVLQRTRSAPAHCYEDSGFDILYENVGDLGYRGARSMQGETGNRFAALINLIHAKNPFNNVSKCGTILQVRLKLKDNGDYVGGMSVRLLDLSKAYADLDGFGNAFWQQVDAGRQSRMSRDQAIRPKL